MSDHAVVSLFHITWHTINIRIYIIPAERSRVLRFSRLSSFLSTKFNRFLGIFKSFYYNLGTMPRAYLRNNVRSMKNRMQKYSTIPICYQPHLLSPKVYLWSPNPRFKYILISYLSFHSSLNSKPQAFFTEFHLANQPLLPRSFGPSQNSWPQSWPPSQTSKCFTIQF